MDSLMVEHIVNGAWILSLLFGEEPPRRTTDQEHPHETQCEQKKKIFVAVRL